MFQRFKYAIGLVGVSLAFPLSSWAFVAELQSISPEPQLDISDMVGGAPERVVVFGWVIDESDISDETIYTAVFTADQEPAGVIMPGAQLSVDEPPVWDDVAGTFTVQFTPTGMKQPTDSDSPENVVIAALVGVADNEAGENGPPEEMKGFWLSTNVEGWELIPPSPEQATPAFGFSLTGPVGDTGFMTVFMPDGIKDLLSEYTGQDLEWSDMAVFDGDNQASLGISEVAGGALFELTMVFTESVTVTPSAKNTTVTKTLTVQEQQPISLASNKTELNKGKQFRLYGWLKNGKQNRTVTVWRKQAGEKTYTKVDTLTTGEDGYFNATYKGRKTSRYRVKYRTTGIPLVSAVVKVTVN
ncbi:MAG: hypothetical protein ACD_41C00103G0002 [uncultured bacterium]|nr:MAG: hypothetical protein ACD_41C00103G0002 [uncultured bacterium]